MPAPVKGPAFAPGDGPVLQQYKDLARPHVDSFDWLIDTGLPLLVQSVEPIEITNPHTELTTRVWFENPSVQKPTFDGRRKENRMFPRDCREAGTTYRGALNVDVCFQTGQDPVERVQKRLGHIPIMVGSRLCHLRAMSRSELVRRGEEANDFGGYFVCNGNERVIRMLIQQKRHFVMALKRGAYQKRGPLYTDMATLVRCVRPDASSHTVRCHYLKDGSVMFAFGINRAEYFIPAGVLMKAFLDVTDKEIFDAIVCAAPAESAHANFLAERAIILLQTAGRTGLRRRAQCLEHLGAHFRVALDLPAHLSDAAAGAELLRRCVFVHLSSDHDKIALLVSMLHKLYALADRRCCEDNADALCYQEVLTPGQLLAKAVRERLEEALLGARTTANREMGVGPGAKKTDGRSFDLTQEGVRRRLADRMPDVGKKVEYLLNTGNLVSRSGLDLQQATGFTIVAEKLNFFRYLSHFRSVHRGAYFAEIRTTTVRKLLPESWGFMCPVHTPDGAPCGLLMHLAALCQVSTADLPDEATVHATIVTFLSAHGMVPATPGSLSMPPASEYTPVIVDGCCVGAVAASRAPAVEAALRAAKIQSDVTGVPADLEVAHIPFERGGRYPGMFLFTQSSRFIRPVLQLPPARRGATLSPVLPADGSPPIEMIGGLEQQCLAIKCPDGRGGGSLYMEFSHEELGPGTMLSVVASLTPFSDYNQSPRNMYQCQMAKQTMGTPAQAVDRRLDSKVYRLNTPQTPLARTQLYDRFCMDEYANGTNAVVAVLSYTGYDMEDAMILNKSSVERGAFHGTMYKCERIDLEEKGPKGSRAFRPERAPPGKVLGEKPAFRENAFGQRYPLNVPVAPDSAAALDLGAAPDQPLLHADRIDVDGLPHVGAVVWPSERYYSVADTTTGRTTGGATSGEEIAVVDHVAVVGPESGSGGRGATRANIRLRYNRNPVIGDKFASRAGQKGVLSMLWPDIDMPWIASSGIRPDLIINPNAFPSRMTIGMLIESMASKAAAMSGGFVDATPFQTSTDAAWDPVREFGDQLEAHGFQRYGEEQMVGGITGTDFKVEIFIGCVYYQRLRHMVSDKFQVRSTGPVNPLTMQPVKGRKAGGGIRLGEMERDSLIAHGAAYLLHDRLQLCSDWYATDVCAKCGSILSPTHVPTLSAMVGNRAGGGQRRGPIVCRLCNEGAHIKRIGIPFVFRYLVNEMAAMNIKLTLRVTDM
ncbi:unnamed protein product [Pedinophyceae sp. YPF-701]|nr:unnamed protein product [Pedinophyceae sp. YPF-701]